MIVIELTDDKFDKANCCLDTIEHHVQCLRDIIKQEDSSVSMRKSKRYDDDEYYPRDRYEREREHDDRKYRY